MATNPFDVAIQQYTAKKKKRSLLDDLLNPVESNPFDSIVNPIQSFSSLDAVNKIATEPFPIDSANPFNQIGQQPNKAPVTLPEIKVNSQVSGIMDLIQTPLNASMRFFDTEAQHGGSIFDLLGNVLTGKAGPAVQGAASFIKTFPEAVWNAIKEIPAGIAEALPGLAQVNGGVEVGFKGDPQQQIQQATGLNIGDTHPMSFSDYLTKYYPKFSKDFPVTKSITGFVGDVALDPTTYVSFGTNSFIKVAGRRLSNAGIDVIKDLNLLAQDGFRVTMQRAGKTFTRDFGINEIEQLMKTRNFIAIKDGALAGDQAALGQLNLRINAMGGGQAGKITSIEELNNISKQLSVENSFIGLSNADKSLTVGGGNTGLFLNIPFSEKRITVVAPETVDKILTKIGVKPIVDEVSKNVAESTFGTTFGRTMSVPPEYRAIRQQLWGDLNKYQHEVLGVTNKLFRLAPEKIDTLSELAARIDETLQLKLQAAQAKGQVSLSDQVINQTRQYALNKALQSGKIDAEGFDVFSKFIDIHNQLATLEINSNMYKNVVNAKVAFVNPDLLSKDAITQLTKGGTQPANIALLNALHMQVTLEKNAYQTFDKGLELLYNTPNGVIIPKNVQKDLDFIGRSIYSDKLRYTSTPVANLVNKWNGVWKLFAYGIKPSSGFKQYVGNTIQQSAKIGINAFRNFDPRSIVDAAIIMADNSSFGRMVPDWLVNGMMKYGAPADKIIYAVNKRAPELLGDGIITSRLGEKIPLKQLYDEAIQHDIYHKGLDVLDLDLERNMRLELAKANGFLSFQKEKWQEGYWTFFKESIPWINLPGHIENMNNVAGFINARRMGYLGDQARDLIKEATFDYAHGLTRFEQKYMRAIVPFYTFQRFAVPLTASLIKEPGTASVLAKTAKEFLNVYNLVANGIPLNDAQRGVLPGFLLEQPYVYAGSTPDGKKGTFHTFNSYNFTDWLSLIETDHNGNLDVERTVQKMTMAQVMPWLKVPVEWALHKNFFTGVDPHFGGKISSGDAVAWVDRSIPDFMKHLIGYEIRIDPRSGEKTGYINPFLSHIMSGFVPAINDYIAIGKEYLNAREFAMKYFMGIGSIKLDFQKEQRGRIYDWKQEVKTLQQDMRKAMLSGRSDVVNEDQAKLQEILKNMSRIGNYNF